MTSKEFTSALMAYGNARFDEGEGWDRAAETLQAETDLTAMFEKLEAHAYALEDQVKGLQELMGLPTDWDALQCKLQEIGLAYWKAHNRERGNGAVKWLQNTETGALFVVTRGEYAQELKDFIFGLDQPSSAAAAIKTLQGMRYTYNGGEQWKPPLGKAPDFDLIDTLRAQLAELQSAARAALSARDEDDEPHGYPGHCHQVRGRWDATGHVCAACAAYDRLEALAGGAEPSAPRRVFGMNLVVDGNMPDGEIHLTGCESGTVKLVVNDGKARDV